MNKTTAVFWYGISICIAIVIWGVLGPGNLEAVTNKITNFISVNFGWYYLLIIMLMLLFCVYLIFSPLGKIKLGKEKDTPEFKLPTWFAMLFSAGMGQGLVFWTTAEPISHAFKSSPEHKLGSAAAIKDALQYAVFHFGVHAWAVYGIVALVLAYFKFYRGSPGLISATLEPLLGEDRMRGGLGKMIDTLAIFATVMGVAATLGFGSAQINGGIAFLSDIPKTFGMQLLILAIATAVFLASSWSGVGRGIKYLSNTNMGLAFVLLLLLLIVGPTLYILDMLTSTLGGYITNFFSMSFHSSPLNTAERGWVNDWTIFYWAWWISWAPFVGIFIARISKGRTIREFMSGVLIVPALVCLIFMAVFGASALEVEQNGIAQISKLPLETATFGMLAEYPLGTLLSLLTMLVVAIFFVTSADSATFVLGMLSAKGTLNPPNSIKIVWGLALSGIAAIVVYFGGTQGLQNVLIIAALPFSIVILLMGASFYKIARKDEDRKE